MPSASSRSQPRSGRPLAHAVAVAACLIAIGAGVAGCETTQEKADKQQARAAHILKARAERQKEKKHRKAQKDHKEGSK